MDKPPVGSQVDPSTLRDGVPVDPDYSIFASPALASITKGAIIRYTLLYEGALTTVMSIRAPDSKKGPESDSYTWYKFADRSLLKGGDAVPIQAGLDDQGGYLRAPSWDCEWTERPGRYIIGCRICSPLRQTTTWCFYAQRVAELDSVLAPMLAEIRENGLMDPIAALNHQIQYVGDIKTEAARRPPPTPGLKERHDKELKEQEDYLAALRAKIEPWQDKKFLRVPVAAKHLAAAQQRPWTLNVYLVKTDSKPARDVIEEYHDHNWRRKHYGPEETWLLVDWTLPANKKVCPDAVEGRGGTDEEAIHNAFSAWNFSGNRYETGWIIYSFKIKDIEIPDTTFATNGRTAWDTLTIGLNLLTTAAVVLIGAVTLFCPVPGSQVLSFAIWTALLSSTAASTINIAQSIDEGSGTWQEYAIDGLTIVSNLLAGFGQVARVAAEAGQAAWGEGAVMRLAEEAPAAKFTSRPAATLRSAAQETAAAAGAGSGQATQVARWVLLGQVSSDAAFGVTLAQGVLIGEGYYREYHDIMNDQTLTPKGRCDRLLDWISRAVLDGAMMYHSFSGAKEDAAAARKKNKYLKGPGKAGGGEGASGTGGGEPGKTLKEISSRTEVQPVPDKLDLAGTKGNEITIRTKAPAEGHTNPKNSTEKNLHTEHETTARTHMLYDQHAAPRITKSKQWLLSRPDDIWVQRPRFSDTEILLIRKLPGGDGSAKQAMTFHATNDYGTLSVGNIRTSQPEEMLGAARAKQLAADPNSGLIVRGDRLYVEEMEAEQLYEMMGDHFEGVAKRTGEPIERIKGKFAFENEAEIAKALEDPALRPTLVIAEDQYGGLELTPEALKYSKSWKYWEKYVAKYGYTLEPGSRPIRYEKGVGISWEFELKK